MPSSLAIPSQLSSCKEAIDRRLLSMVHSLESPPLLQEALDALLRGGRRMRPLLMLATTEGLGTSWSSALETACALECLHLAACGFDAAFRGITITSEESVPIRSDLVALASNALTALAYHTLSQQDHLSPHCRLNLIHLMTQLSGGQHFIRGQLAELQGLSQDASPERLWEFHRLRTGSFMRCALESAGLIAQTTQVTYKRLGRIGEELGIAYQLIGDILECQHSPAKKNHRKHGISAVDVLGVALARSQALQILEHAQKQIRAELRYPAALQQLAEKLVHRLLDPL